MNWSQLQYNWRRMTSLVKTQWPKLTEEDVQLTCVRLVVVEETSAAVESVEAPVRRIPACFERSAQLVVPSAAYDEVDVGIRSSKRRRQTTVQMLVDGEPADQSRLDSRTAERKDERRRLLFDVRQRRAHAGVPSVKRWIVS